MTGKSYLFTWNGELEELRDPRRARWPRRISVDPGLAIVMNFGFSAVYLLALLSGRSRAYFAHMTSIREPDYSETSID